MRGGRITVIAYFVWAALLVPLTCVLPMAGVRSGTARLILFAYGVGFVTLLLVGTWSMRREARRLSEYDAEIHGVCPVCGYDLRATPRRCPECGRATIYRPDDDDNQNDPEDHPPELPDRAKPSAPQ